MSTALLRRRALLLGSAAVGATRAARASAAPPLAAARGMPRHVLALYDSRVEPNLRISFMHRSVAMPLEWLGLVPRYHDIRTGLPDPTEPGLVGAVTCFPEPCLPDIDAFASWVERLVAAGKRMVILGDIGIERSTDATPLTEAARRRIFAAIGLRAQGAWQLVTLGDRIIQQEPVAGIGFEHGFEGASLPPFEIWESGAPDLRGWLVLERAAGARRSHVLAISGRGGFAAPGYLFGTHAATGKRRWRFDPFAFLEAAFGIANLPRPDTTTLCGRRVYYSHIDGDAWQSVSQVRAPGGARATNAEIILRRVIEPNPDLPVTVAPIGAEIDLAHRGDARAIETARVLFALPQVEVASHTYTHPFDWSFYENYQVESERPFQEAWRRMKLDPSGWGALNASPAARVQMNSSVAYVVPRAYGDRAFDLTQEMGGAAGLAQGLAPAGKRCALLQWSGDCSPFPAALRAAAAAGLANINGGDTRCDNDNPTVTAVAPMGLPQPGMPAQIYASNSNENTYTELWSNRFFGFRDLPVTWTRTEAPRRLKPMNLYYHMYSGERLASLGALLANIAALRQQPFIGVATSRFSASAAGFYAARIDQLGDASWRVRDRGGLSTLRFSRAAARMLDAAASTGVLGEQVVNGDLYVALDPADPVPVVALMPRREAPPPRPLLVEAGWEVSAWEAQGAAFRFTAQGLGEGQLAWRVPRRGGWRLTAPGWQGRVEVGPDHLLAMRLPALAGGGLRIAAEPA